MCSEGLFEVHTVKHVMCTCIHVHVHVHTTYMPVLQYNVASLFSVIRWSFLSKHHVSCTCSYILCSLCVCVCVCVCRPLVKSDDSEDSEDTRKKVPKLKLHVTAEGKIKGQRSRQSSSSAFESQRWGRKECVCGEGGEKRRGRGGERLIDWRRVMSIQCYTVPLLFRPPWLCLWKSEVREEGVCVWVGERREEER